MIGQLAWRNIWRNQTRSLVVILALMMGLIGALFIASMTQGMVDKWVETAIDQEVSDIQVNDQEYLVMEDLKMTLNTAEIAAFLSRQEDVRSFSAKLSCDAMAMTANNAQQVKLIGIDPEFEKNVSSIHNTLIAGDYFESNSRTKPIVVSQKLCDKLKIRLKSKIVVNLADVNNQPQAETFNVVGVFKTSNSVFDEGNVFVLKKHLHTILGVSKDQSHVISVRVNDTEKLQSIVSTINEKFDGIEARTWKTINPTLEMANASMGMYSYILVIIVLVALVFGIINTMLMVILERTKEIGMLRALGMAKKKIAWMIMSETVLLCSVGVLFGNTIAYCLISWFGHIGISLERYAEGFEAYGMSSNVYPSLDHVFYLNITIMVVCTAIFASIFPIIRAFKLNPATAIRD